MLRVTIDGAEHAVDGEQTVLGALRAVGVDVPAACDDPRLDPVGACRLCIVGVDGRPQPVTACTTALVDGMAIDTRSDDLQALRHELVRMLALEYPQSAPDSAPDKPFHVMLRSSGVDGSRAVPDPALVDDSHPYIHVDMNQCITCFRCSRICADVQGQFTWQVWERGAETKLVPDSGTTLADSSCVSCGACVDTCPTGALEDKSVIEQGAADEWTRTVCPYCGVGCELDVGTRDGHIVNARPALDAPVNKGHLCVKGRYAHGFVDASDRVTAPMIRHAGTWEEASWDDAVDHIAGELGRLVAEDGPGSVAVLGSARATNEDNYLAQKFARAVLGTNNVDCCARVCHTPSAAALSTALGTGAATNAFDDIERARTIVICGSNTTENHPIVGARIKQAKLRGANLVVIDPREIELASYADVHLAGRPGSNVPLLNSIAHVIVEENLVDEQFLAERVDDVDAYRAFVAEYAPEEVATICGVAADDIRRAARLYAAETPSMLFHGLGVTEHEQGTDGVMCLINLALLTGNVGKPGTGVNPLRGQNNVQGSAVMGCEPNRLTGSATFEESGDAFESVWGAPIPRERGLDAIQMLEAARGDALEGALGHRVGHSPHPSASGRHAGGPRALRARRGPGPLHERDRTRVGDRVPSRVLVVRARRHVHELRASHPARPYASSSREVHRSPTGRSCASSRGPWEGATCSRTAPPRTSGRRSGGSGRPPRASATSGSKAAVCSGPARPRTIPGPTSFIARRSPRAALARRCSPSRTDRRRRRTTPGSRSC